MHPEVKHTDMANEMRTEVVDIIAGARSLGHSESMVSLMRHIGELMVDDG